MRRVAAAATFAVFALVAAAPPSPAPRSSLAPQANFGVWTLHYTTFVFDTQTGDFDIPDHVLLTRNGGDVSADRATGNFKKNMMTFFGDVVVHDLQGAFGITPGTKVARGPATLTTDQLQIDGAAKNYVATGNVHYTQGNAAASAQRGRLDDAAHVLYLDGDVRIARDGSTLLGDHVRYETLTAKGHASAKDGAMVFPVTNALSKNAKPTPAPSPGASPDAWTVHYTQADFDSKTGEFSIPTHVLITRNAGDISADRASGNGKRHVATFYGNVVVHDFQGTFGMRNASSRGPATLTTDQLAVDDATKVYVAKGHVQYAQADTTANSESGKLDDRAHTLDLDGNARVVQGQRSIEGAHIAYNTVTGDAHADDPSKRGVLMTFPGGITESIATPRPIVIKNPFSKKAPQPTPTP